VRGAGIYHSCCFSSFAKAEARAALGYNKKKEERKPKLAFYHFAK